MEAVNVIAVTQARTGSTRLPGKILMKIENKTILEIHLKRIKKSKEITKLVVATTSLQEDTSVLSLATSLRIPAYAGSVNDVLDRFYNAVKDSSPDFIVRLTSDCPLIDPSLIDRVIRFTIENDLDYGSNTLNPTYPDGQDIEVFKFSALVKAWKEAALASEREHVTPFIWKNSTYKCGTLFKSANFEEKYDFGHLRMTIDEERDFQVIENLIKKLGWDQDWLSYAKYLNANVAIRSVNESITRNEGYTKSLNKDYQNE